jgi:hypothetical protein
MVDCTVTAEDDILIGRIGRINVVCDRISTPVKLSPCQKRSYVDVGQEHGEFTGTSFSARDPASQSAIVIVPHDQGK